MMKTLFRFLLPLLVACGLVCSPLPSRAKFQRFATEWAAGRASIGPSWFDSEEAKASQCTSLAFTSTGGTAWVAPAGIDSIVACGYGGGGQGGGGGSNATQASGGGGGGSAQYSCQVLKPVANTSYTITAGAGGTGSGGGGTGAAGTAGAKGGNSTFGAGPLWQWRGASGGGGGSVSASGSACGGSASQVGGNNEYCEAASGSLPTGGVVTASCFLYPGCGGWDTVATAGVQGADSEPGFTGGSGGALVSAGGGGGGGGGRGGGGANGGAGVASGAANNGGNAAANSGAGGGGGGGQFTAASAAGTGGNGGSGEIWTYWCL